MGTCTVSPGGTAGNPEASSAQEAAWKTGQGARKSGKVGSGSGSIGAKQSESQAPISSHGKNDRAGPHHVFQAPFHDHCLLSPQLPQLPAFGELALLGFTEKFVFSFLIKKLKNLNSTECLKQTVFDTPPLSLSLKRLPLLVFYPFVPFLNIILLYSSQTDPLDMKL